MVFLSQTQRTVLPFINVAATKYINFSVPPDLFLTRTKVFATGRKTWSAPPQPPLRLDPGHLSWHDFEYKMVKQYTIQHALLFLKICIFMKSWVFIRIVLWICHKYDLVQLIQLPIQKIWIMTIFFAISHCLINFYLLAISTQTHLTPSPIQFRYIYLENTQEMIRKSFGQ